MDSTSAKEILNNLYDLLIEVNLEGGSMPEINSQPEEEEKLIQNHLMRIRRLKTQYAAQQKQMMFDKILAYYRQLKKKGIQEIKNLLPAEQVEEFAPLYRKLASSSKRDEEDILDDEQLLQMIEQLKNKIDENTSH